MNADGSGQAHFGPRNERADAPSPGKPGLFHGSPRLLPVCGRLKLGGYHGLIGRTVARPVPGHGKPRVGPPRRVCRCPEPPPARALTVIPA